MDVADIGVPQQPSIDETFGHALTLNWEITPEIELRSITAYRDVGVEQYDNAGGAHRPAVFSPNGNFSRYSLSNFDQFQRSQEFQLVGSMDRLDYVVGLFYFNEKVWDDAATPSTNRWNATGTGYTINDPTPILFGGRSIDRASKAKAESSALFVHMVYTPPILDDKLHITLGGRQTNDKKSGVLFKVNNAATNLRFDIDNTRFDPVVTAAFDLTPDINLYGTYSTGYRAGGASSRSLTYRSFDEEEVESLELGLKSTLFDRLRVNLAAYKMERTDSQIDFTLVTINPLTNSARNTVETVNAPGVTDISGLEIDGSLQVTDDLSLTFGYAFTETKVPDAVNPFSGLTQKVFIIYTPENAMSGAIDYSIPLPFATLKAHVDANYADGAQSFEQFAQLTDDSFIVNASLALADIELKPGVYGTLSLWSRNLLDEEHIYRRSEENRTTLGDYANFNEPRTFGAQFSVEF
jgi:iron complex outermembrane receptor protein